MGNEDLLIQIWLDGFSCGHEEPGLSLVSGLCLTWESVQPARMQVHLHVKCHCVQERTEHNMNKGSAHLQTSA